jgi:hypothetical protein
MGLKTVSELGNVSARTLWAPDGARRSAAVSSEYGESQVSARKTGVTGVNMHAAGANLGHRPYSVGRSQFCSRSPLTRENSLSLSVTIT